MKDRVTMLDVSELYRPEIEVQKGKSDREYRRFTFDVWLCWIVQLRA